MSRVVWLTLVSALLAAPVSLGSPAAGAKRIGLLPLDPVRLPGDALVLLQDELRARLERRAGIELLAGDEMMRHLKAIRELGLSCGRESAECLTQIGALANVPILIRGVVERREASETGFSSLLRLWLHDTSDGRAVSFVWTLLPGDPETRADAIDDLYDRLFDPGRHGGELSVVSEAEGAEVLIDSLSMGVTPLELRGVLAGQHVVEVRRHGHVPLRSLATVTTGEGVEVYASLPPAPNVPSVPVVEPGRPLDFGNAPAAMFVTGSFFVAAGLLTAGWGIVDNLTRNAAAQEVQTLEAEYADPDESFDVTRAGDAAELARYHGVIQGEVVPFWAVVGGTVTWVFGLAVVGVGFGMLRLEEE